MEYFVRHRTTYRYLQDVSYSWHLAHLRLRDNAHPDMSISSGITLIAGTRQPRWRARTISAIPANGSPSTSRTTIWKCWRRAGSRWSPRPSAMSRDSLQAGKTVRALLEDPQDDEARDAVQFHVRFPADQISQRHRRLWRCRAFRRHRRCWPGAIDLMNRIHEDFRYDTTVTDATTPVDRVFEIRAGVCQDLAHVGIAAMRSLGLPARYVSGYLLTEPPPGRPRLLGADASHAWFSRLGAAFRLGGPGPHQQSDRWAKAMSLSSWGRDYGDVAPVAGIILGGHDHVVEVGVDVIPVDRALPHPPHIAPESPPG